ncbi:uncharacterized protein XM38_033200 [Halomicronema hongdechloris C2206]|uniref:Peptidase C14 n=1 Tax=Halomicronema hongdechloris C2206 TaxID=1641165 RepID=A0A1Z3HPY5_9CYAN|nr:caspase family protein [Halomicronema hongdechloris]ASC72363.1 uncharacterized protein XM38_033200 [Halomicronema hongdechloris C2206]
MANYWAVIAGINQYQALQPLLFAQFDAEELHNVCLDEAGMAPERCQFLSDISPAVKPQRRYPDRQQLQRSLTQLLESPIAADDVVWWFFSGYGVVWQGEDYLLPIDGDPRQPAQTAIPIAQVFDTLKQLPTRHGIVVLDINRSEAAVPGQRLGVQTVELAESLGIPLLLSCQPEQFSYETLALRHGLFTAALLEGLRYRGCRTLSQLAEYVTNHLPALSRHHLRPVQNPVAVVPPEQKFLLVLPADTVSQTPAESSVSAPAPTAAATTAPEPTPPSGSELVPVSGPMDAEQPAPTRLAWLRPGLAGLGLLLLGALLGYTPQWLQGQAPEPEPSAPTSNGPSAAGDEAPLAETAMSRSSPEAMRPTPDNLGRHQEAPPALDQARTQLQPLSASAFVDAIKTARQVSPEDPGYEQAQQDILRWSRIILDLAEGRAATGNLQDAIAAAQLVPADQPTLHQMAQERIRYWQHRQQHRQILQQAQASLQPGQASAFQAAILQLQQIPPASPEGKIAQDRIDQWSEDILVIARARAAQGRFAAAIAAAELIPEGTAAYDQAQQELQNWRQEL